MAFTSCDLPALPPNLPLQLTIRSVTPLASTALSAVVYSVESPY